MVFVCVCVFIWVWKNDGALRKYSKCAFAIIVDIIIHQNIVGSCDVKFPVKLEGLAYEHEDFSSYGNAAC